MLFRAALGATRNKSLSVAFSRTTAPALVQSGPYRYVRHPLYTSYVIFWISCALVSGTSLVAILVTAIVVLYVVAARMEEQDIMGSELGPAYRTYMLRTGMLLPSPFKAHE